MEGLVDWQKIDLQKIITEILASKNTCDWNTVYTENWIHLCVCALLRKKQAISSWHLEIMLMFPVIYAPHRQLIEK